MSKPLPIRTTIERALLWFDVGIKRYTGKIFHI